MTYNSYQYEQELFKKTKRACRFEKGMDPQKWQEKAREKMRELLGLDLFEKCSDDFQTEEKIREERNGKKYEKIRFSFQSEPGYRVSCCILLPEGEKKHTPVICLQGHSTGMHISLGEPIYDGDAKTISGGDRDFARRAVEEGLCPIAMEQRYMGSAGGMEDGVPSCCRGQALDALLLGRCAIGERVWDVMRLIDVMEKYFADRLDMKKLICMGNSGGGTATFYAGCMEERIACVMPSCAFCSYEESIVPIQHCDCNYIPGIARYFEMGDVGGLIAPRYFMPVAGEKDDIFLLHGVREALELTKNVYEAMNCEEKCRLVIGPEGHRFYADQAWNMYHQLVKES